MGKQLRFSLTGYNIYSKKRYRYLYHSPKRDSDFLGPNCICYKCDNTVTIGDDNCWLYSQRALNRYMQLQKGSNKGAKTKYGCRS